MKKNKLPSAISILVLTLITALVWVSLNIYRALTASPPPAVPQNVSQTLTPTLNQDAINKIESSTFLNDSQIPSVVTGQTATGTPVPTTLPVPTATPIETLIASPSATP
jgi:hypothetical protein